MDEPTGAVRTSGSSYDSMIDRFAQLHRADPSDLKSLIGLARYLRYAGRANEAIQTLEAQRASFAEQPAFLTELGAANLAAGNTAKSKSLLLASLKLSQSNWRTYATLGIANDILRQNEQAQEAYLNALRYCPDSASIRNNLGLSAGSVGRVNDAIVHLAKAQQLQPDSRLIRRNVTMLRDIQASCVDCSAQEYQKLARTLNAQDWPIGGGDMTCGNNLMNASHISDALNTNNFVDMKVHFAFDSAVLLPEAEQALDRLAQAMMTDGMASDQYTLEGHTDAVGTDNYNDGLSNRRSRAVLAYLASAGGIAKTRLDTVGYGESRLLNPNDPESGVNRRVRVVRRAR
jgi:outer membrane protein OmpA-like peptidoglycan-associated protein